MSTLDNSAGRLHQILNQAKSLGGVNAADGWATILEVTATHRPEFWARFIPVLQLPARVRRDATLLGDDPSVIAEILDPMSQVEIAFTRAGQIATIGMPAFLDGVQADAYYMLNTLSARLHALAPEKPVADVARWITDCRELIDDISDADDLTPVDRALLIARLRDVETALLMLKISGRDVAEATTQSLVGAIVTKPGLAANVAKSSVGERLKAFAVGLLVVLDLTASATQIAANLSPAAIEQPLYGTPTLAEPPEVAPPPHPPTPEIEPVELRTTTD